MGGWDKTTQYTFSYFPKWNKINANNSRVIMTTMNTPTSLSHTHASTHTPHTIAHTHAHAQHNPLTNSLIR